MEYDVEYETAKNELRLSLSALTSALSRVTSSLDECIKLEQNKNNSVESRIKKMEELKEWCAKCANGISFPFI